MEEKADGAEGGSAGGVLEFGSLATYKARHGVCCNPRAGEPGTGGHFGLWSLAESAPGLMRDLASKNKV